MAGEPGTDATRTGAIMGTFSYMAPEQAAGRSREVGPAADVYALGAVLYEVLTGRPPFVGETDLDTLQQVQAREPVAVAQLRPRTPRDLETICLKCLQKEPARRYPGAGELAADLRRFLAGEAIRARRSGRLERGWRWCRRKPLVAGLLGAVAGLVVVVAVGSALAAAWLKAERDQAEQAEQTAERRLFDALLAQAEARRASGRAGRRFDSLRAVAAAAPLLRRLELGPGRERALRNEAIAALALADLRLDQRWTGYPRGTDFAQVAFDPTAEHFARQDERGNISIRRMEDNKEVKTIATGDPSPYRLTLRFSPDGRWLAGHRIHESPHRATVWEVASGRPLYQAPADEGQRCLAFSPDSTLLAVSLPGAIGLLALPSGRIVQRLPGSGAFEGCFSPDGRRLALDRGDQLHIVRLDNGQRTHSFPTSDTAAGLAWSGDGRLLAAPDANEREVHVWDVEAGRTRAVLRGHNARVAALAFSPDGRLLASTAWDGTTRLWDPWTGSPHLVTQGDALEFSRDGRWLSWGGDGHIIGRWEVASSRVFGASHAHPDRVDQGEINFSPDGRLLATVAADGVQLWDVAGGRVVAHLPGTDGQTAVFHPSGDSLLTVCRIAGLRSWPLSRGPGHPTSVRVGAPQPVGPAVDGWVKWISPDREGKAVAMTIAGGASGRKVAVMPWPGAAAAAGQQAASGRADGVRVLGERLNGEYLAQSPDGRWVALGPYRDLHVGEGRVKVWDVRSGKQVWALAATTARVVFSPDGRWLAISCEGEYRVHRVGTWELVHLLPYVGQALYEPMAFSRDGRWLAVIDGGQRVKLLDTANWQEQATLTPATEDRLGSLCFSPDGRRLAVATTNQVLHLWDLWELRRELSALGLDWDSSPLAPPAPGPPPLRLEMETGAALTLVGEGWAAWSVAAVGDGRRALSGWSGGVLILWDLDKGRELRRLTGHTNWVRGVAVSADGRRAVSASEDHTLRVWDLETGRELRSLPTGKLLQCVALSKGGRRALAGSRQGTLELWDLVTQDGGGLVRRFEGHTGAVLGAVFSPDGSRALSGSTDGTARLWDVETGKPVRSFRMGETLYGVAFSPDGRFVFAGGGDTWDGTSWHRGKDYDVRQWDAQSGKELGRFRGHRAQVTSVAVSPDGRRLVSAGEDGTAVLWDVASGSRLWVWAGHRSGIVTAAFLPGGDGVLTGGRDGTLRLWKVPGAAPGAKERGGE